MVFGVGFTFHRMACILSACLTFITLYYKKKNFFKNPTLFWCWTNFDFLFIMLSKTDQTHCISNTCFFFSFYTLYIILFVHLCIYWFCCGSINWIFLTKLIKLIINELLLLQLLLISLQTGRLWQLIYHYYDYYYYYR